MELLNATPMQAGFTIGMRPDGRELLVVIAKGTFRIPEPGRLPGYAEQQKQLVEADVFSGEPGFSAPLYEVDYAPFKHRCDILLNGSAYAPNGKPAPRVEVALRLGPVAKSFVVTGDRFWEMRKIAISPGYAALFDRTPISYDHAFGGIDNFHKNEKKHSAYMSNPAGKGYHRQLSRACVEGSPMPNTEQLRKPVRMPNGDYAPMAFGPLGRAWDPRRQLAGTYDQNWIDNTFPFLPPDFNERYYQSAPIDQQMRYPRGGEPISLQNLTPAGQTSFTLPEIEVPVVFFYKKGPDVTQQAVIDTIVLEPDEGLFTMTWRTAIALKKNIFEIPQALVGKKSRGWWHARKLGKTYYPSLDHLARDKQTLAAEED